MTSGVMTTGRFTKFAHSMAPTSHLVALSGLAFCVLALLLPHPRIGVVAFGAGAALLWASLIVSIASRRHQSRRKRLHGSIAECVAHDMCPSFTTDMDGRVGYENSAAVEKFGGRGGQALLTAFEGLFAAPNATFDRLQSRALATGAAQEDVVTRRGHMRLSVHMIGTDGFLWRLEDLTDLGGACKADSIAMPMLTLSKSGAVGHVNGALRDLVGGPVSTLDQIVADLPLRSGDLHALAGGGAGGGRRRCVRVSVFEAENGTQEVYFVTEKPPAVGDWEAFDALPVALLRVALDGSITQSNCPAREILATSATEGLNLGDVVEGLGRSVVDWVSEVALGRAHKPEFVRASKSPNDTFLQVSLNRVETQDQVELIAVLSDATELKSLEAQFVQSQKMQAIGQLAGGVAHDFNNLLTAISGHCDLLLLRHDKEDVDYSDLVQIHQNANRAASLVGQLLAFSRKQTLKPEVIDLRDTLADLTHLLNRLVGERVTLTLSHDSDLAPIRVDKRQLEQVIMNLVVNARDAMTCGGEIKVETCNVVLTAPLVRDRASVPEGAYVLVKVIDQGVGIPPERLQKVFEPFFTTKRTGEGTGLGLSTVYGIIKQTGGFIFLDSVVGSGTEFSIYLPAHVASADAHGDARPAPAAAVSHTPERGSGVVLLVEDEAPVRAFASRALRMRGYTVIEADCAEEALETLSDETLEVDLFVTDVIMPGMDGPTWVSQALEARPGVKVVFVSGYAEDHFSDQQAKIPNSVFLPKPFSLSELTATVQTQLQ